MTTRSLTNMKIPYPHGKENKSFSETLFTFVSEMQKQKISQYVSEENMQSFHHGREWSIHRDDETDTSKFEKASIELSISLPDIAKNDFNKFFEFINQFIEGFTTQMISQMYQTIGTACEKTGNIIKQSNQKSNAEDFLEMLNKIEFSVDENGSVLLPQIHLSPDKAKDFIAELNQQGPEFLVDVEKIKKEKSQKAIDKENDRLSKYRTD